METSFLLLVVLTVSSLFALLWRFFPTDWFSRPDFSQLSGSGGPMVRIRYFFLAAFAANLVLLGWEVFGGTLVGSGLQLDDWQYFSFGQPDPVRQAPYFILGAWLTLEFFRIVSLGGCFAEIGVAVVMIAVMASVAGPMVGSITDQGRRAADLAYSVGGAKDINNFRANLDKGCLPQPSDLTFEGLFYDYSFETGKSTLPVVEAGGQPRRLFYPTYACAVSRNPLTGETERYLAVGLNSDLKEAEFARKKLNLVVVLDISGSMSCQFDEYYYDRFTGRQIRLDPKELQLTKLEIAERAIVALTEHLRPDDRLGIVLFDDRAVLAKPLRLVSATNMDAIRRHILAVSYGGCTNMEDGLRLGSSLLEPYSQADPNEWENRVIFMTDAMPNTCDTSEEGLLAITRENARKRIYLSFVGIGLDFNSQLIESITKIRGANYCSVHSDSEFRQRLADEFEFLVTPLLFDLSLSLDSQGFAIEQVFGSPEADQATGELLRVNTLFPSRSVEGEAKGGLILLKLRRSGDSPEIRLNVRYVDRQGRPFAHEARVTFPGDETDWFDNRGIRKGILLARYGEMLKTWLASEKGVRQEDADRERRRAGLGIWERPSHPLTVPDSWKTRVSAFLGHFRDEQRVLGDPVLQQEIKVLEMMHDRASGG